MIQITFQFEAQRMYICISQILLHQFFLLIKSNKHISIVRIMQRTNNTLVKITMKRRKKDCYSVTWFIRYYSYDEHHKKNITWTLTRKQDITYFIGVRSMEAFYRRHPNTPTEKLLHVKVIFVTMMSTTSVRANKLR